MKNIINFILQLKILNIKHKFMILLFNKNGLLQYLFQDIGVEDTTQKGGKKGSQTISASHRVNK